MRGVLTQIRNWAGAPVIGLLTACPFIALGAEPTPPAVVQPVTLSTTDISDIREPDSLMSWKIQKFQYVDGTALVTVAGVQFEESLGLSVVVLDPPPTELLQPTTQLDISKSSEKRLPGEPPRAEIQVKNLLVELNELALPASTTLASVPECERGARRAVVFLRSAQTARIYALDSGRAARLTRYGRAACLRWDGIPEKL
ncbi:MAG: hypothetical protein RI932_907 [Pseudomonadota bacterium]